LHELSFLSENEKAYLSKFAGMMQHLLSSKNEEYTEEEQALFGLQFR